MKKLKVLGLLILIGINSACSNDDENTISLNGIYTETSPNAGTHHLNFIDNETVILKARNSTDEEFFYELKGSIIELIPKRDLSTTWELRIRIKNNSKFEIANIFYPSIPEDDDPLMFVTFEK